MHERSIEEPILQVKNLKKYFPMGKNQILKAVDDVSFEIQAGKTLGLVGESGCGKTTCGRTCTGLYAKTDGEVLFKGKDVHALRGKERKAFTKSVQTIFQDPYASLNPRMKVGSIIAEGLRIHHMLGSKSEREEKVQELLNLVGLQSEHANRYIHEFSGGQRQRIGIARALAIEPEFLVCDEPISALDVSIQAQVVNMFEDLQDQYGLTYLFIAHDLSVVRHISNRIGVMYLGSLVELAESYGATVQGIDTLEETIQLLTAGRIDATLNADVSFYDYLNVHPDADFKLVAQTEDASHVAIPVRKGDDSASLLEAINTAIDELRADGTLKALGEKYFGQDISSED